MVPDRRKTNDHRGGDGRAGGCGAGDGGGRSVWPTKRPLITTGGFSAGARKEANAPGKTHIGLIDGEELLDLLVKHRVGVVERPLTVIGLDDEFWGELAGEEGGMGGGD